MPKTRKTGPSRRADDEPNPIIGTGVIRARVDPSLKRTAEGIFSKLGLNASEAIRLFYSQVALVNGLPFEVKLPNAATERALREVAEGKLTHFADIEALRRDLDI